MTDEPSAPYEEQTTLVAERVGELHAIALRTLELAEPVMWRVRKATEWTWREPSRLLTITLSPEAFTKDGHVVRIDVRAPGRARTISIENTDGADLRAGMRRDPVKGARRLLDEVRMAVTSAAALDQEAQSHAELGRALAIAERLGVDDREWMIAPGSILHGPGTVQSYDDLRNATMRDALPGHGPIRIVPHKDAVDDLAAPTAHPDRQPDRSPVLCTLLRRTERVKFDQHDAATKMRALADHMRAERP
jgi:hypothetical protein